MTQPVHRRLHWPTPAALRERKAMQAQAGKPTRAAVAGPARQCPRCKAWYAESEQATRAHQCPPRWIARDPWGDMLVDQVHPLRDEMRFWGIDAGAAAVSVVEYLHARGEVAETCDVFVRQLPAGAWYRVRVRLELDWYATSLVAEFERDECSLTIGAERVALVGEQWRAPA